MVKIEDRTRKLTVLAALAIGMTLTSGLLLLIEPPSAAPMSGVGVTLQALDPAATPAQERDETAMLFDPTFHRGWRSIVIHDTGSLTGSAQSIHRQHQADGRGGLGYHFVINRTGDGDKLIEPSYRWQRQDLYDGAMFKGDGADDFNRNAIGICVIGDLDAAGLDPTQLQQLTRLVQRLQQRYHIPPAEVYVQVGSEGRTSDTHFPTATFRARLLPAESAL